MESNKSEVYQLRSEELSSSLQAFIEQGYQWATEALGEFDVAIEDTPEITDRFM